MSRAWTYPGERCEVRFFSPKVPKPQPAPPPPTDQKAIDDAEAAARLVAKQKKGRSSTILTSPSGAKLADSGTGGQKTLGVK